MEAGAILMVIAIGGLIAGLVGCAVFVTASKTARDGDSPFQIEFKVPRLFSYTVTKYGPEDGPRHKPEDPHQGVALSTARKEQGPN
jgi:hypothetical protein